MRYTLYYRGDLKISTTASSIRELIKLYREHFKTSPDYKGPWPQHPPVDLEHEDWFLKCDEDDKHVANLFLSLNEMIASNLNVALTSSNEFLKTYAENCVKNKGALEASYIPSTPDQNRYCLNGWIAYQEKFK